MKVSQSLKEMGHGPTIRRGNGHGPTTQEQMLAEALGWTTEFAVPTKIPKGNGYPTCYKIDVAAPWLKVGIEIDGNSHCVIERQQQDRKKEECLAGLGWTILRFTNKQVTQDLAGCVRTVLSTTSKLKQTITTSLKAS